MDTQTGIWARAQLQDEELAQLLDHVDASGSGGDGLADALLRGLAALDGPASASALADELPQPPSSSAYTVCRASSDRQHALSSALLNFSTHLYRFSPRAISTIPEAAEDEDSDRMRNPRLLPLDSDDDLAAERPPSALFKIDTAVARTPHRRNTFGRAEETWNTFDRAEETRNMFGRAEEAWTRGESKAPGPASAHSSPSLSHSSLASSLLEDEMPPQSPLFATVPARELAGYHESMQQLRKTRRNTMTEVQRKGSWDDERRLLEDEMPPQSPFFGDKDLAGYHESMRRLRQARRSTLGAQRATWCSPSAEPMFATARKPSVTLPRPSLSGMLSMWSQEQFESPSKRGGDADALVDSGRDSSDDDWIFNQQPPQSPLFASYHSERARAPDPSTLFRTAGPAGCGDMLERWFQVDVQSLFAAPFGSDAAPKVRVREVAACDASALVAVDADDPDVLAALASYLSLLSLRKNRQRGGPAARGRPTSLRVPSRSRLPPEIIDFHTPALSFMVRSKARSGPDAHTPPDWRVRAVDLEAMVEAYLPHVYAEVDAPGTRPARSASMPLAPGALTRSPSESSVATLAEPPALPAAQQPQKRVPAPALRKALSNDVPGRRFNLQPATPTPSRGLRPPRALRASASVMNLRSAPSDRLTFGSADRRGIPVASQSLSARSTPAPVPIPRRRSEALPRSAPRADSSLAAAARPRPLRASFSQQSTLAADSRSRLASPRTSLLSVSSSHTSVISDAEPPALAQRRWSSKSGGAPGRPTVGRPLDLPAATPRASLRYRKDMAPLTLPPIGSHQLRTPSARGVPRPLRTTSSVTGSSQGLSRTTTPFSSVSSSSSLAAAPGYRRRGISTGSQAVSPAAPRPQSLLPPSRTQVSGRRPDIRQVFGQDAEPRHLRRTTIAHQPPPVERSAVRQRIGAKLSEFRSKLFSP